MGCIAPLVRARQPHGVLEVLRVLEFDVHTYILRKTAGEQARLLECGEFAGVGGAGLERLHVRVHRGAERQAREVGEVDAYMKRSLGFAEVSVAPVEEAAAPESVPATSEQEVSAPAKDEEPLTEPDPTPIETAGEPVPAVAEIGAGSRRRVA